jgi:NAD(P)H-flavin reductase
MNDAMKTPEIEKVIEKVKGLAAKTHRSNHNNEKIKEGCKMTKTAYKKVCLDNLIFYDFHNILD